MQGKTLKGAKKNSKRIVDRKQVETSELCTYFAKAMQSYVRKNREVYLEKYKDEYEYMGLDKLVQNALLDMDPYVLADEVIRAEKDIKIARDDLIGAAKRYIESGGKKLSEGEQPGSKTEKYLENRQKAIVGVLLCIVFANSAVLFIRTLICLYSLEQVIVSNHPVYIITSLIISAAAWVYMTTQDYFNYQSRKWRMLWLALINDMATLSQISYTVMWKIAVVKLFSFRTGEVFTPQMVMFLARGTEVLTIAVTYLALYKLVSPFVLANEAKEKILRFKLSHIIDMRKNRQYAYDFVVVKDLASGKPIVIKENDLYTHMLVTGASGTGKTSSVYEPQIVENVQKKQRNVALQQSAVYKMVKEGKAEIIKPFDKDAFSRRYFKVTDEKFQKEFDQIFDTYRECGITVVAPNNSMNEDILSYCSGRGIYVYNIDPTKKKATHKYEILAGMNPFYLPPKFYYISPDDKEAEEERTILIAEAANNFADALTAINEQNGTGDQYFTDVNTTVTSAVATVLMLHASINNTQTTIEEVYENIVDFQRLESKVKEIKDHFAISDGRASGSTKGVTDAKLTKPGQINGANDEGSSILKKQANPYSQTLTTVECRLKKGSKMDEHAEGLRNLIGKLLQDPRVKRVLVKNPTIIDFDDILANNAITVVNTALEFGQNTSTCFGQLFLLSFNTAVLRRPKKLRSPHFFYEDETARFLNDTIDTMVTLYRQYNVACMFALQSLEQVEKIPKLKYLRNSLLSSGTTITFGRASYLDAETISNLGGQKRYMMVQHTKSYTSELSENASSSFSDRTTPDTKNYADPHDVRYRDFQECTITTTDNGNVLPARFGKTSFVPDDVIHGQDDEQIKYNETWRELWKSYYPAAEDTMPISSKTTVSSGQAQRLEDALLQRNEGSVIFHEKDAEEGVLISQMDEPIAADPRNKSTRHSEEDLAKSLTKKREATKTMSEEDLEDELAGDDIETQAEYSFTDGADDNLPLPKIMSEDFIQGEREGQKSQPDEGSMPSYEQKLQDHMKELYQRAKIDREGEDG